MDAENEQYPETHTSDVDKPILPKAGSPTGNLGASNTEIQSAKVRADKARSTSKSFDKPEKVGLDRFFELALTCAIVYLAWSQVRIATTSAASSTTQLGQIIVAADRINAAADSFSISASHMNNGISDAVNKLESQAKKMDAARISSENNSKTGLKDTIDNFHRDQRAWLSTDPAKGIPKVNANFEITFPITNSGRTPATNVVAYFMGGYMPLGQMSFKFEGLPIPLGYIAPGSHINFRYGGTASPDTVPIEKAPIGSVFVVYGAVTYADVFSTKHWITYCFFSQKEDTYAYCQTHNEIGDGSLPPNQLQ